MDVFLKETAAFGAQTASAKQPPASDSWRLDPKPKVASDQKVEGRLTAAPIEEAVLQGDDDADVGDADSR
jgi:hypothetical protein